MTTTQRKKLAKAARELASLYAEGRGPDVTNFSSWCGCLAGVLVRRAGVAGSVLPSWIDQEVDGLLSSATAIADSAWMDRTVPRDRRAPVFPLLWLADELEAQR